MKLFVMTIGFPTKAVILRWPSRCCSMSSNQLSGWNRKPWCYNAGWLPWGLQNGFLLRSLYNWASIYIYLYIYVICVCVWVCECVCVYPLICCTSKRSNKSTKGDADHCSPSQPLRLALWKATRCEVSKCCFWVEEKTTDIGTEFEAMKMKHLEPIV